MSDNVKNPEHYTKGGIETIDYIKAKLSPEEFAGYCKGNVLKYVSRESDKGGTEDLKKARVYLDWLIESREESKEVSGALKSILEDGVIFSGMPFEGAIKGAMESLHEQMLDSLVSDLKNQEIVFRLRIFANFSICQKALNNGIYHR